MTRKRHSLGWAAALMWIACVGCNTDPSDVTVTLLDEPGSSMGIAGQWSTTTTEVRDTCGFDPVPPDSPLLVEEGGEAVVFTFVDAYGFCEPSARSRTGDFVTLTVTDTIEACGGMVLVQSNIAYEFSETGFRGTSDHTYSNLTSQCSNLPCQYDLAVSGIRCESCWPGCAQP